MFRAGLRARIPSLQQPVVRFFHPTPASQDFHFDTHHFVQRLEKEGLTRTQAEGIMTAMADVIDESIKNMASNMVTKADQEKASIILSCCVKFFAERAHSNNTLRKSTSLSLNLSYRWWNETICLLWKPRTIDLWPILRNWNNVYERKSLERKLGFGLI